MLFVGKMVGEGAGDLWVERQAANSRERWDWWNHAAGMNNCGIGFINRQRVS